MPLRNLANRTPSGRQPAGRPLLANRIRDITVKHARALVTTVDCGSVTKAAQVLNLSQPALSRSIKDLEDNLDCNLIVRGVNGMELTPQGLGFLPAARRLLACYEDALLSVNSSAPQITSVGVPSALADVLMPHVLSQLKRSVPALTTVVRHGNSQQLTEQVLNGTTDQVVAARGPKLKGLVVTPLLKAPYGLLFSPSFAALTRFRSVHDLAGVQLVRHADEQDLWTFVGQCLPIATRYLEHAPTMPSFSTALALVNAGVAATITTGITASHPGAQNLLFTPLSDLGLVSEICFCTHPTIATGQNQSHLAAAMQHAVRTVVWHQSVTVLA